MQLGRDVVSENDRIDSGPRSFVVDEMQHVALHVNMPFAGRTTRRGAR